VCYFPCRCYMLLPSEPPINIVPNIDRLPPVREVALPYFQDSILNIFPITSELFFLKLFHRFSFWDHSLVRTGYLVSPLHATWPKYLTHADLFHPSNTLWGVHVTEPLIMQFPPVPCNFLYFRCKYSLRHPVRKYSRILFTWFERRTFIFTQNKR